MSSKAPDAVAILDAHNFEVTGPFFYEVTDPTARNMDTHVVYAGVAPSDRRPLAESAVVLGLGFLNPHKARWLGGLVYHAMLVEPPPSDPNDGPAPELVAVRNQLAAKYAASRLADFVGGSAHRPKATGVEPGWTVGKIYAKLGERTERPWVDNQREQIAVMLNDPGFGAVVMARWQANRFSEDDCVEGDPTTISIGRFIDTLNASTRDSQAIFGDILTQHYGKVKREFIQALFAWANGKGNAHIFGRLDEYYQSPEEFTSYL